MLDFSTFFRDMGTIPAIIGIVFVGLLVFSLFKGGKGNGNKGGSSKGGSSGSTTPPSNPA